ncbi:MULTISPECIES: site-specific integrase [unclassified Gordonia (in: high G+C Gram-positive bacteria)]|uniref:tyrosine-type recombinase/integrase n=1 Tax=unclassified Gordonia (in: high G+C Gram-positive bacteria) TaxID=2657482 RepID=UPI0019630BE8|nr:MULTISPECIES: site-specific integrase [unclassified Gordonia (in: high G+C Gram-positive bacteria)]MBN0974255.1 site-specific integrase [Gordonia sp. BP-119]MBN0981905.1 site-specific integrase [Gordonia sp. BP-94]
MSPRETTDVVSLDDTPPPRTAARRKVGTVSVFDRHYSDARRKVRRGYSWTTNTAGKAVPKSPLRWEVRYIDTAGKQRYERFEDRDAAHARRDELADQFRSGSYIEHERSRVTVRTVADTYVRTLSAKPASTRQSYGSIVDVFCGRFGDREVGSLVVSDINGWIADLLDADKSLTTVRKYANVVRKMLDVAVDDRLIRGNPARGATVPKSDRRTVVEDEDTADEYLTPADLDALLPHVADEYTRRLLRFQSLTGLRIGEVCELRRKDIDTSNPRGARLKVRRSAVETKGGLVIGTTKSGLGRKVPLSPEAASVLREALAAEQTRLPKLRKAVKGRESDVADINALLSSLLDGALVFRTARGKQFRGSNVNRALATACEAAGVDKVTTHAMRHAWASHAVAIGTDVARVAELLGHADSTLVHRVYAHAGGDDELFAAVEHIAANTHQHTQSTHDDSTSAVTDGQSATDKTL